MHVMDAEVTQTEPETARRKRRAVRVTRPGGFRSIVISRDPADFSRILEPEVVAVLIERPELRRLGRSLPSSIIGGFETVSSERRLDDVPVRLRAVIARDAALLDELLHRVGESATKRELLVVPGKECSKFHVDFHSLRALVTYVGAGTWLAPNEVVDTAFLCTGGDDVDAANARIVTDPRVIVRAESGDIVLLKGARFINGQAAVHRSPPERIGRPRLMLKVTSAKSSDV
jgi:hypothetical protein